MARFADPLVPLPEAAAALGIALPAAYKRIERRGTLHPFLPTVVRDRDGRYARIFVSRAELDSLLSEGRGVTP